MSQDDKASDNTETAGSAPDQPLGSAQDVIAAFGGIRPTATKLGVAVSTVQGWKERNVIPASRHAQVREAAAAHDVDLSRAASDESSSEELVIALDDRSQAADFDRDEESLVEDEEIAGEAESPVSGTRPRHGPGETEKPSEAPQSSMATHVARVRDRAAQPARKTEGGSGLIFGFLLGVFAMSLGFGGAILSKEYWLPLIGPQAAQPAAVDTAALDDLTDRLSGVSADVALQSRALQELRDRLDALPLEGGSADMEAVIASLTGELEARLKELERGGRDAADARQQSQRLGAELAGVADRTAVLEARLGDLDRLDLIVEELQRAGGPPAAARDVAIMLSLVQLRETLSRGAGFRSELDSLRGAIGNDLTLLGHLAPLEAHADAGLPTLATLSDSFSLVARDIVSAAAGGDGEGVVSDVLRSLSNVVSVRPIGEVDGEGPAAIVARVEARMRDGDLAGALETLSALDGAAADAAAEWRGIAEGRLAAEQALGNLGRGAVDRLAETG